MTTEILKHKIGTKINTFIGEAIYSHTEIEDPDEFNAVMGPYFADDLINEGENKTQLISNDMMGPHQVLTFTPA